MNILFTLFSFNVGGIERLLVDICQNWNEKDDKIHVCIINKDYDENILSELENIPNINLKLLNRTKGSKSIKYFLEYVKYIKDNKISIIHCQSINELKFSFLIKFVDKNVKFFHTVHATNTYKKYNLLETTLDKIFTTKLIAISKSVKNEIITKNIKENKIEILYNGINFKKFNNKNRINKSEQIKIGCVARLDYKKKGQDLLIKSIFKLKNKYPNIQCYLAGDAYVQSDFKYLNELVKDLNMDKNIYFMGTVNDVSLFLKEIDIFVLPSRYEGFGIAVIEAIASKLKIIVSNIGGPKEIVETIGYGYLFEKDNIDDLSGKIELAIKSNDKFNIEKAYNLASKHYDIKNMVKKLRKIYVVNT